MIIAEFLFELANPMRRIRKAGPAALGERRGRYSDEADNRRPRLGTYWPYLTKSESTQNFHQTNRNNCASPGVVFRMRRIETYRDHAWQCLALAKCLTSERERQALIEMAAVGHELAEALGRFIDKHDGQDPEFGWRDQPGEETPWH